MRQGWSRVKLGDISSINYGYTAKASFDTEGPKFLRITDIQDGKVDWATVPSCPIDDEDFKRHELQHDDIVFARTGATTGKSYRVNNPKNSVAASYLIRLRLHDKNILPSFVSFFFQTSEYWDAVNEGTTGSAQGGFNASKLGDLILSRPPLSEQKRIVAILDEAFAAIDQAIANTEKNLASARELFESTLNTIFTQKGEGWEDMTFGQICENLDSKRIPITKSQRASGEIPYYGASGVVDHVADFIFNEDLLLVSEDGANLLARTYPIAFSISGKTWVNNHAHVLRFEKIQSQKFVEYYLNSISLAPYVSGMAQPKLNQKSLNSIPVPFPPAKEQEKIVEKLDILRNEIEILENIYQQKLASLNELKQSLLQKAFSGELTTDTKLAEAAE